MSKLKLKKTADLIRYAIQKGYVSINMWGGERKKIINYKLQTINYKPMLYT